jgi:hypothetical protein
VYYRSGWLASPPVKMAKVKMAKARIITTKVVELPKSIPVKQSLQSLFLVAPH